MTSTTPMTPTTAIAPLYLSRLVLSALRRDVQYDLSNCHFVHRRILMAFPDQNNLQFAAREQYGVLYRVEADRGGVQILVQSLVAPDWSRLPEGYLSVPALSKRVDVLYTQLRAGMQLVFRLCANPTRRISNRNMKNDERWRGKRVDLRGEENQIKWLFRKGEEAGFRPILVRRHLDSVEIVPATVVDAAYTAASMQISPRPAVTGFRRDQGKLTFGAVTFDGRLQVTDAERLRQALVKGVGSGKAYGFGLLSVAPVAR